MTRSSWIAAVTILAGLLRPTARRSRAERVTRRDVAGREADLYAPPGGPWPGVVLVLGALREGRRYELLEAVARSIAACGFAVMVPELGRLRELILGEDAVDDLVGAALAVAEQDEAVSAPCGLIGFSLGGSLALVAAADGRLRGRVACVATMGAYFRLTDMLAAATTSRPAPLAAPPVYAVAASLAATLAEPDRAVLLRALDADRDHPLHALLALERSTMGGRAQKVLALLRNRDPEAVAPLLGEVDGLRPLMERLSPATILDRIDVPVFALHDARDRYVPVEQLRLMRAAARGRTNFRCAEIRLLEHTEPVPPALNPVRLLGDYVPGVISLARFVHGPLNAVRRAAAPRD